MQPIPSIPRRHIATIRVYNHSYYWLPIFWTAMGCDGELENFFGGKTSRISKHTQYQKDKKWSTEADHAEGVTHLKRDWHILGRSEQERVEEGRYRLLKCSATKWCSRSYSRKRIVWVGLEFCLSTIFKIGECSRLSTYSRKRIIWLGLGA